MYRIAIDTGGTFTDTVLLDPDGKLWMGKGLTRPDRGWEGIEDGLEQVGAGLGRTPKELLEDCDLFLYGTTRSTNAILTDNTPATAFITNEGHPDILVMREGGREEPFNLHVEYPKPYVSREYTYEVGGRVRADGEVIVPIDEAGVREAVETAALAGRECFGVCLLWSVLNPEHELAVGRIIEEVAPDRPYTLSHQLNPIMREYRRASSAVIDASLKPLMGTHLGDLERDLRAAGLRSDLLVFTSLGGLMHVDDIRTRPILTVKSGPSMAPVAARAAAAAEGHDGVDIVVCDTGGTSFDVSLIPAGEIKFARDGWIGKRFTGHMTGMSSVDIRSIGSGGGSIGWVDGGGLLRVGPQSAGADPGPASYGKGGTEPTVTDAAVRLGYLDAERFAAGRMPLDAAAADAALAGLADELGLATVEAAQGVLTVATEDMIGAIKDITIKQGFDPRESILVAGGGAAGINVVPIARELGIRKVLLPQTAGALSAGGGHYADIVAEESTTFHTDTADFDADGVAAAIASIRERLESYGEEVMSRGAKGYSIRYWAEARYPAQVWEIDVPLDGIDLTTPDGPAVLAAAFHDVHRVTFAVSDPNSVVECVNWKGRLTAELAKPRQIGAAAAPPTTDLDARARTRSLPAHFPDLGEVQMPRYNGPDLAPGDRLAGPAAVDEPTTTIVVYPGATLAVTDQHNYLIDCEV